MLYLYIVVIALTIVFADSSTRKGLVLSSLAALAIYLPMYAWVDGFDHPLILLACSISTLANLTDKVRLFLGIMVTGQLLSAVAAVDLMLLTNTPWLVVILLLIGVTAYSGQLYVAWKHDVVEELLPRNLYARIG